MLHAPRQSATDTFAVLVGLLLSDCCHLALVQPKVYNRDGKELGELPKGDMYIRDLKNTKG